MARSKSRKVWKRFRSSFNSMKQLQQSILAEQEAVDDGVTTEINTSRNFGFLRGVKRQCFGLEDAQSVDGTDDTLRSRSFLETKWESQTMGRRRKLPAKYREFVADSEPMDVADNSFANDRTVRETTTSDAAVTQNLAEDDESPSFTPDTLTRLASEPAYRRTLHGQAGGMTAGASNIRTPTDIVTSEFTFDFVSPGRAQTVGSTGIVGAEEEAGDAVALANDRQCDLIGEAQQNQTIASTARQNTAGDKDTVPSSPVTATAPVQDLTAEQESTLVRSALRSSLDGEDAELLNNFLSKAKAKREAKAAAASIAQVPADAKDTSQADELEVPDMPTPQRRRALEDLNTNSPSPQKTQLSPSKGSPKKPHLEDEAQPSPQATASPRRSTRNRNAKKPAPSTAAKAVRNTFSLRRAKGTEFVFLQRTEAQELALTTRRNTRQNKGDALLPKFALADMAKQAPPPAEKEPERQGSKNAKKQVSWNEDCLVQFEGEDAVRDGGDKPANDVASRRGKSKTAKGTAADKTKAASSRTTRSRSSPHTGDEGVEAASTTAPATASSRARRVRRLGTPAATPVADDASTTTSPAGKRKKLTPKSPKANLTGTSTPVSKKVGSNIPIHGKTSTLGSSSAKSTSLLKAHAGSTPMPRRVRPRS
ncbi:hypothetical protein BDV59DRAFT_188777 [Aspergillus ambiguus]|uniref:uncharacterized protein n=1 Tax=Aspergillus ambiguus TaxID=176160 RepID=UPI003CCDE07C